MTQSQNRFNPKNGVLGRIRHALWSDKGTLGQKALRSSIWLLGSAVSVHVLRFVQMLCLVRLLMPSDFGVMRIAGFVLAAIGVFSQTGFAAAIVQRRTLTRSTLDSAWSMSCVRNVILFFGIFLAAPWAARFYGNPLIIPVLRLISLRLLFGAFSNHIGRALLRRDLQFHKHETVEIICNVAAITTTIIAAFVLRSVFALVLGQLFFGWLSFISSYWIHPYRPRFEIDWKEVRALFSFGKHLLLTGIILFLRTELDDAILGKLQGTEILGLYTLAFTLSNMPATFITHTISAMSFAAYSRMQDDRKRLAQAFLRVIRLNAALSIPAAMGLMILAPQVVHIIYPPRYGGMVHCFQALCFFGALRSLGATMGPVFTAIGKPFIVTITASVGLITMVALIYPLTIRYSLTGTAWATVAGAGLSVSISVRYILKLTSVRPKEFLIALGQPALACAAMGISLYGLKRVIHAETPWLLMLLVALGFVAYAGTYFLIRPQATLNELRDLATKFSRQKPESSSNKESEAP
jgi:O-antigen/teichoic acid export membrane protein